MNSLLRASLIETVGVAGTVTQGGVGAAERRGALIDYHYARGEVASVTASQRWDDIATDVLPARRAIIAAAVIERLWGV